MKIQLLIYFLFCFAQLSFGSSKDSLIVSFELAKNDSVRANIALKLSTYYADETNLDSALYYADIALGIAEQQSNTFLLAKSFYNRGYANDLAGKLDEAISQYEEARKSFAAIDDKEEVANCMNAKGVAAYFAGDFEPSLNYYLETLSYVEEHNIETVMANTLNNIGVIYRITGKQSDAIDIYHKTLALSKKTENDNMVGTSYHNLGVAYNFEKRPTESLTYLDSSILHYQAKGDLFEVGRSQIAKGETYYLTLQNYVKARSAFKKGMASLDGFKDQEVISKTYLLMAQNERDDKNYGPALTFFNAGLELLDSTERDDLLSDYYKEMEVLFMATGNIKEAHNYLSKYISKYKEVQSIEKQKAIEELQTKYETQKKEQEIVNLNFESEINSTKLKAARKQTLGLLLGLLIVSVLLFGLYRLFRKTKVQNKIINETLDEKSTLLKEIHHRVKNNLQVISALLTLQSSHLKDIQAKEALQEGQDRVQSMALIHKDLYQHDNLKGVNTKDYLEQLIENLLASYKVREDDIELTLQIQELNLDVDTMIPLGLTVNELISNALKHAFGDKQNAKLRVSLAEEEEALILIIQDNGKGTENIDVLKDKSFGYSLVQSFAKKLDAALDIKSDQGLTITLNIKNYKKQS